MVLSELIEFTFQHQWEDITMGIWKKYPNPELNPDVVAVDLLDKQFDPATGVLKTKRLCTMKANVPSFLEWVLGNSLHCYFLEECTIDPKNNTLRSVSKNLTWQTIGTMQETCTYSANPNNRAWTDLKLEGKITVYSFAFSKPIENWMGPVYRTNADRGRKIMEATLEKLKTEGAFPLPNTLQTLGGQKLNTLD